MHNKPFHKRDFVTKYLITNHSPQKDPVWLKYYYNQGSTHIFWHVSRVLLIFLNLHLLSVIVSSIVKVAICNRWNLKVAGNYHFSWTDCCCIMHFYLGLKDSGTFSKCPQIYIKLVQNVHRFTLNLQGLKIMIAESFPSNITYWGAVVFEKWVKQCHENTFVND